MLSTPVFVSVNGIDRFTAILVAVGLVAASVEKKFSLPLFKYILQLLLSFIAVSVCCIIWLKHPQKVDPTDAVTFPYLEAT